MKVDAYSFQTAVLEAVQFADPKSTMPVLTCLHLNAENSWLSLEATRLDESCRIQLPCEAGEIDALVDAGLMAGITRRLPSGEVNLALGGNRLQVDAASAQWQLPVIASEKFPKIPTATEDDELLSLKTSDFEQAIKEIAFVPDADPRQPWSEGIYLEPRDSGLTCVATDGNRLALSRLETANIAGEMQRPALVLASGLKKAASVFALHEAEDLFIAIKPERLLLQADNILISVQRLNCGYPNYKAVLDRVPKTKPLTFDRQDLLRVLQRVGAVGAKHSVVSIKVEGGHCQFVVDEPDGGTASDELHVLYDGPACGGTFQIRYLTQGLKAIDMQDVSLTLPTLDAEMLPGVMTKAEDDGWKYLFMPVRQRGNR